VLIPRPETEHVVEAALALELPPEPWILDVGTGSGCLAVTLALEISGARGVATDLSAGALAVAADNARRLGATVSFLATDLTRGLDLARFDLAVSNPPYIDPQEAGTLSPEICKFEPHLALFPPGAGDLVLARLFAQCSGLRPGVRLLVEIGHDQLAPARRHAAASGFELAEIRHDYSGIPRVLALERR
jgi:release factor glutamine methyltransferase